MSAPVYGSVTEELNEWMLPLGYADEQHGYALKRLCATLAEPLQPVDDLVRGDTQGPGWHKLFNADDCPDFALPWLEQPAGVTPTRGSSDADRRAVIKDNPSFRRGTVAAVVAAAQRTLIAPKVVTANERFLGEAYHVQFITYDAQTPDPTATEAAIRDALPAGLILFYETLVGQTWRDLRDGNSGRTWTEVEGEFTDWDDVRTSIPI